MPHASHCFCLHIHNRGTNQLAVILDGGVAEDFERSSRTNVTTSRTALITTSANVSGPCPRPTAEILRPPTRYWRTERHRRPNSGHLGTASLLQPLSPPCTKHCICPHPSRCKACFRLQQRLWQRNSCRLPTMRESIPPPDLSVVYRESHSL